MCLILLIDLLVKILTIFEEEYVDKIASKSYKGMQLSTKLKDGIRLYAIDDILGVLMDALNNY